MIGKEFDRRTAPSWRLPDDDGEGKAESVVGVAATTASVRFAPGDVSPSSPTAAGADCRRPPLARMAAAASAVGRSAGFFAQQVSTRRERCLGQLGETTGWQ